MLNHPVYRVSQLNTACYQKLYLKLKYTLNVIGNDNTLLSVTYFVQYNTTFKPTTQANHKLIRDDKSVRISSKRKSGQGNNTIIIFIAPTAYTNY